MPTLKLVCFITDNKHIHVYCDKEADAIRFMLINDKHFQINSENYKITSVNAATRINIKSEYNGLI